MRRWVNRTRRINHAREMHRARDMHDLRSKMTRACRVQVLTRKKMKAERISYSWELSVIIAGTNGTSFQKLSTTSTTCVLISMSCCCCNSIMKIYIYMTCAPLSPPAVLFFFILHPSVSQRDCRRCDPCR